MLYSQLHNNNYYYGLRDKCWVAGDRRWTSALPSMLKLGWSGPGVRKNTFTHAPHGGGAV